ncbi:unnamed protein product [Clonostachys chloroleuca]|uniref:NADH-cytochrome b5 reductase 1 n=1 Tax=Clonostachys chloroleuca TaxID=1926264 RepID=A0AA35PYX1_9HYPO|nr:unnamed protein product [Clonostachys chloroleuca]
MGKQFTQAEVAEHNTKGDLYIVLRGKVYDLTPFVDEHPGSAEILIDAAGQDCTEAYDDAGHSDEANEILLELEIGTFSVLNPLVEASLVPQVTTNSVEQVKETASGVLKPDVFQEFELHQKTEISHNVAIYRFKLPNEGSILGLPIGQHISIGAMLTQPDGTEKEVIRSYTPISGDHQPGYFDLLIKVYPQGNITQHLAGLKLGNSIRVRGPKGAFTYTPNMVRHFGMIAGGTGLTPMLQIIRAIIRGRTEGDKTEVDLIFANVNEHDILLRKDLEQITKNDHEIRIHHVLNNPPENWSGGVGFVNLDMISRWLPKPAPDVKILLCGPPPMISAMKKTTESLGFSKARPASKLEDQVFSF